MKKTTNQIYLVTGLNEAYLSKAKEYIQTMHQNSNVSSVVITLDFDIPQAYREKYRSIRFVRMDSSQVKSLNSNFCMQHGGFLSALDFVCKTDIIIYTDADIKMQRGFTDKELDMLGNFDDDEIGIGYNKSEEDFLSEEVKRLKPNVNLEDIEAKYPGIFKFRTYNTGVLIANYRTYSKLYDLYNQNWEYCKRMFDSYAKQQWLLSYLINKYFTPRILPDIIHTHGHYPVELRTKGDARYKFCIGLEIVVFNHAIKDESEKLVWKLEKQIRRLNRRIYKLTIALIILILVCIILMLKNFVWNMP